MSLKTLYFYPGFMGKCDELSFLNEHYNTIGIDLTHQQVPKKNKKAIHYAYSMGGRLLLNQLSQRPISGELLILESVGAFNEDEPHQLLERRKLDEKRAQAILDDFPSFLESWYSAPLWNFNEEEKKKKIDQQVKLTKKEREQLAKTIVQYSPSIFPVPQNLSSIFSHFHKVIYLYGEKDEKYAKIAQRLQKEHSEVSIIPFPNLGHNIHYQRPDLIISTLLEV